MKEFYITDDGIRLHAKLDMPVNTEKCPLVIFIHGVTGDMEEEHIVAAQKTMNAAGFAVLRAEMYGHGKSGGRFEDHTLFKWISNALKVTEYARKLDFVTDLYITGHSQGGLLAMIIAGMRPDDFKAAVLLSPAVNIPEDARKGSFLGIAFDPDHIPEEVDLKGTKLKGNYLRAAQMIHVEDPIRAMKRPVLIIHGDADETIDIKHAFYAAGLYENCRLVIIPGDTHCYDHYPEKMTEALQEFLQEMK
ncbi:MAG: lysophospholipase [Solobacterium sp.]|nr:lysophospholipase [Solobacterium sp.]